MTSPSERTRVRRLPERGSFDRATIHGILDEAQLCHIGLATDAGPVVIPTLMGRRGDTLYVHGSPGSRLLRAIRDGAEVSVCASIVDGLVLAKSLFHHSMNYRSVVAFGTGRIVDTDVEALDALEAISEHVLPGRWDDARQPSAKELRKTTIIAIDITEASAKVRAGPPVDDDEDLDFPVWSGIVPLTTVPGTPEPDENANRPVPVYLQR